MEKKTKRKLTKTTTIKTETSPYKAILKVMGNTFEATGANAYEAIGNLKPRNPKGRSILVIEKDKVRKERIFMPQVTSRLFSTAGLSREIALKQVSSTFQGI